MSDAQKWKCGNEFAPYHRSASHVEPGHRDGWNACYRAAQAEIERLTAELLAAREDARRYRWLRRGKARTTGMPRGWRIETMQWEDRCEATILKGDELDAAIDSAMKGDGHV